MRKKAIIIGGGPAGLTAAYELLQKTDIQPIVFEESDVFGGISKTINYKGNRIDIGGHRFFSKNQEIMNWWNKMMPIQSAPALDDILLDKKDKPFSKTGVDPEKDSRVMLIRERISRIFYLRNFFDYPISLKFETFANMGLARTCKAGFGFLHSSFIKKKEDSLEKFYINRFGKPLYNMFFEDYTEKVWGIHPSKLAADWGSQRIKGLSLLAILKDIILKPFRSKDITQQNTETSLIEQFIYPKLGPGQLWEIVADEIQNGNGTTHLNQKVVGINIENQKVVSVDVDDNGHIKKQSCEYLLSSMPIKDLISVIKGIEIPEDVQRIAQELPYRDFITVGLLVKKLKITNKTKNKTYNNRVPDTWIYIQERDVKVGRLQIFNNWSPYMVADYENTMFIGLEYFCSEGDELWTMQKDDFIKMAISEMEKIDIIDKDEILDATHIKIKKAYPSYFGSYYELDKIKDFLNQIENLYCIGRNGQHRYNNMDHSMLTAMEAIENIRLNKHSKENIWSVNTEEDYHETKNKK